MKKRKLNEDLFIDVPEVEYELDTNIDLEGPQPGNDVGVSAMLLDLIGDIAKTISNYNQLQADLEDYPEIAELIKDFADDENVKLGKVQSALKTISPNAEYIMNGAAEADQELDPGSPIDESFKEDWRTNKAKLDWDKLNKLCSYIFDESQNVKEYCSFKYKDNYLLVSTLLDGYHLNSSASRDSDEESKIRSRCKEKGIYCRISPLYHRDSFDVYEGIEVQLKVPYDLIGMDKYLDNESLKEDTNFVNKDVINLLNDYFRNHLRADNTWAEVDSVEVVGKDTYKVEVHFKGINSYSTIDSDGYRYTEYEDTDEYKTYVVKVSGNYVSIISNESLKESADVNKLNSINLKSMNELIDFLDKIDLHQDYEISTDDGIDFFYWWMRPRINLDSYPIIQIDYYDDTIFHRECGHNIMMDIRDAKEKVKAFINR